MSRLTKDMIWRKALEMGCLSSPTLNMYFEYVFVGFEMKDKIELSKRKANIYW